MIHRIFFLLTCAIFAHLSFLMKSFIIFPFLHFICPVPINFLALPYSIYLPVTFLLISNESYEEELFQVSIAHRIHYNQSIVWVVVMNNQNIWNIIQIEKSNTYKWDRTNHSLNITTIILLLISYEMKITKYLSICFILNTNVRSYRIIFWIQKIENIG